MYASHLSKYLLYQLYHAHLLVRKISPDDPEPLHQFRVALRRVRSLLKLYANELATFPKILKTYIRTTNSLRELDVFLLSLNPSKHPHILQKLAIIQKEEYARIFTEEFITQLTTELDDFYDRLSDANLDLSREILVDTALRHYEQSITEYQALPEKPTDKQFHSLRIRFKISRYGLEFLHESSIESEKEKIAECKQFQNRFGGIQDLANQVQWLKKFSEKHPLPALEKLRKDRKKELKKLKAASR